MGLIHQFTLFVATFGLPADRPVVEELPSCDWSETWSKCKTLGRIIVCTETIRSTPMSDSKALAEAYRRRAEAYDELRAEDRAIADYSEAIRIEPASGETYLARGVDFLDMDKSDAAIRDFREAVRLSGNDLRLRARSHFFCAMAEMARREFRQAIEDYSAIIKIDPEDFMYVSRAKA
jgi:tetratricopeptide (TPR) repeat protein